MTRKQKARRSQIIAELANLSRNGWRDARRCDWEPLEQELRAMETAS